MPRRTVKYEINLNDLERDLALYGVLGEEKVVVTITDFSALYSIPVDPEKVAEQAKVFQAVADKLNTAKKGKKTE